MLLNELTTTGLHRLLSECRRILVPGGRLLAAVTHPAFVHALGKKGALTDFGRGLAALPGAEGIRLPVSRRPALAYLDALSASGFTVETEDVFPDEKTFHARPGLKLPRATPLALLLDCQRYLRARPLLRRLAGVGGGDADAALALVGDEAGAAALHVADVARLGVVHLGVALAA